MRSGRPAVLGKGTKSRTRQSSSYLEIFPGRSIIEATSCGKSCPLRPSEMRDWAVGQDMFFGTLTFSLISASLCTLISTLDDNMVHTANNHGGGRRVVLLLDITRDFDNIIINAINQMCLFFLKFNPRIVAMLKRQSQHHVYPGSLELATA